MKRISLILTASLLLFSGCTGNTAAESNNLEAFDVVLDWYPNAVHGFIYTAVEQGYYEEEGLEVNIIFPSGMNDAMSLPVAGKADVGIYYMQDAVLAKANQDVPVKAIGAVVQEPLNIFMSLKENNINGPQDFAGKIIGQSGSEISEKTITYLVENAGGNTENIQVIDVGFDLMSAITTGNVDVTLGGMVNHELPQMEKEGFEINYFYPSDYGVPSYYELVFVTGQKQLDKDSEKLKKFLRASKKGFEFMKNNPEKTLDIILENQNQDNFPLNKEVEMKSMEVLLPVMETESSAFLNQDNEIWEENIQWLYENGIIEKKIKAEDIVVDFN